MYKVLTQLSQNSRTTTKVIFFFKQKTAYEIIAGDWSSDVCSSDLGKESLHVKVS